MLFTEKAALPEPLRRIHFCPLHWRPWIAAALTELPTRVVLAHIGINAKPCWGADEAAAKPMPQRWRKRSKSEGANRSNKKRVKAS